MAISSRNGQCSSFVASVPSNGTGRAFATSFNLPSHAVLNTGKSTRKMYMAVFEWIKFVQRFCLFFVCVILSIFDSSPSRRSPVFAFLFEAGKKLTTKACGGSH